MKKISMIIAVLCIAAMTLAAAACGGSKPAETTAAAAETTTAAAEETTAAQEETTAAAATGDLSNPDIVVEYGDVDALNDIAKKAQSFEIEEGTVVKIDGIFSEGVLTPSIVEDAGNGNKIGITMYLDDEGDLPADGSDVEVVGCFVKGSFFMEFHVSTENITEK